MKTYSYIVLTLLCFSYSSAQIFSPDQVQITAGISLPTFPNEFYDYWMNGYGISGEFVFKTERQFDGTLSISYDRFAFDKVNFFKKLWLEENQPSFSGAVSSIATIGANVRYLIPGYKTVRPFVSAGIVLLYSYVSESTIGYEYSPVIQGTKSSSDLSIPIGASLEYSFKENIDIVVAAKHYYGMLGKKNDNTNFTTVRVGIVFFLKQE